MHCITCADQESIVRGGPTLTTFFLLSVNFLKLMRGEDQRKTPLKVGHHRLGMFVIYRAPEPIFLRNLQFCDFSDPWPHPPLSLSLSLSLSLRVCVVQNLQIGCICWACRTTATLNLLSFPVVVNPNRKKMHIIGFVGIFSTFVRPLLT